MTEQIFSTKQIIEKENEFRQKAFNAYVCFKGAFDAVVRDSPWDILSNTSLLSKYVRLLMAMDLKTESYVQINGRRSKFFPLRTGTSPTVSREFLAIDNTLWCNTVLASGTAIGFVIYTGKETQSAMNNSEPRSKVELLDLEVNQLTEVEMPHRHSHQLHHLYLDYQPPSVYNSIVDNLAPALLQVVAMLWQSMR
ncbi:hypothetical protein QYM36_012421 [Artemia franciscana]|uniref:Uncharacterized protein n=1 Tax=Artemia franciscana TaxID=6661 RepID=A0AA88HUY1_ARTSF|nr:hypothetical protein QYM36_012421 [Artemia franciscana]